MNTTTTALTVQTIRRFELSDVSALTGLHEEYIQEIVRGRLVDTLNPGVFSFDERGLCRLRQIADLHRRQGLNLRTVRLIVRLLDRLEQAEEELRSLRELA